MSHSFTERQVELLNGRYRVCFTSDPTFSGLQLHAIDRLPDLDAVLLETIRSGRIIVALASLTHCGPRVEFLNPPPPDVVKAIAAAHVPHIDTLFSETLRQCGFASTLPLQVC